MAQKEIVMQQVRMGKQRDLPVALEKGQIGFSTDVCRMFVGLPSTSDPASLVAGRSWNNSPNSGQENVEIITEFTPWDVVNGLVYRPYAAVVPATGTKEVYINSTTRLFLDYVGYSNNASAQELESGSVQFVVFKDKVMVSQQNNTSRSDGIAQIEFLNPSFDANTNRLIVTVSNKSPDEQTVEFILRGWNQ